MLKKNAKETKKLGLGLVGRKRTRQRDKDCNRVLGVRRGELWLHGSFTEAKSEPGLHFDTDRGTASCRAGAGRKQQPENFAS